MKERGSSVFRFLYSQHFTIFTIAISVFSDLFLYGFVIILLPDLLRRRCEVPEGQIQGTLAVLLALYNGIIVFATPLSGYLADRLSNKRTPFLISLVALGGATFLFALGTTTTVLGLARLLQGVSAAVVWSVGLALLTDTVGTGAIGNAMGWIQIAISLGSITGPLAGGVLYTQVGHNGTFAFAVGLVGVDVIMRMLNRDPPSPVVGVEEEGQQRPQCEESLAGSAPPSVMAPGERTPLLKDQPDQNSPGEAKTAKAGSFVLLKLLMDPEVPFHLMFSATAMMSQTAYETIIPLHFQNTYGWSTQKTSLAYLPLVLPVLLGPMIGSFHDRYGPDILYILGLVLSTISCPLLAMGRESVTQSSPGLELTLLAFIGVSFVLLLTPAMAEVSSFGKKKAETHPGEFGESGATAQCCGLLNMSLAIGGVLGPLLAGFIRSAGGWYLTNLVLGAWPQIWLVVTLMRFGWKLRKGRAKKQLLNA